MYQSKGHSSGISIPRNYSGSTFRVIDESDRKYISEPSALSESDTGQTSTKVDKIATKSEVKNALLPSFLESISLEDILLLGLMFVIHAENPNDTTLLLLLILLLVK